MRNTSTGSFEGGSLGFDYRTITPERVATLTDEAIAAADLLLANAATALPTSFEGTVQPIDDADALVYAASGRGAFMARVHPEAAVRDAGQALPREELDGLPEDYVGRLAPGATDGTYRVTLASPDYSPFLENARRRDLRQELERRFFNRALTSNRPVIAELLGLRRQLAHVLGYAS